MAQFPLKNGLLQGTLDGTPTSGTVDLSSLTLTLPVGTPAMLPCGIDSATALQAKHPKL